MKRIVYLGLAVSVMLFATESESQKRAATMQALESGLATVQKGFLYNNTAIVDKGAKELQEQASHINSFKIDDLNKDDAFKEKSYAHNEAKAIAQLSEKIANYFKRNKKEEALAQYTQLQERCIICHKLVRKW